MAVKATHRVTFNTYRFPRTGIFWIVNVNECMFVVVVQLVLE